MNRIAIFYLLASFCISVTLAQADREKFRDVKQAVVIDSDNRWNSRTFRREVALYKIVSVNGSIWYDVQDGPGNQSPKFRIHQHRTVVTDDVISIEFDSLTVTLTMNEIGDTFNLYREVCPLEGFDRDFTVRGTFERAERFDKVSAKHVNRRFCCEWIFMVQNGNTPRLIFPAYRASTNPVSDISAERKLTMNIKANRNIPITIEFDNSEEAAAFYNIRG